MPTPHLSLQHSSLSTPPPAPHTPIISLVPAQLHIAPPAPAAMALVVPSSRENAPRTQTEEEVEGARASFTQTISDSEFRNEFADWDGPLWSPRPVPSLDRFFYDAQDRSLLANPYSQQQQSSVKRLMASQSNVQSFDPLFYAKYSPSLPTSLLSSPKRDRSTRKFVLNKTENGEMKIDEVGPEEEKNHRGRDEKQQEPSFPSSKGEGKGGETCASGKPNSQEKGGMLKRARSLSSSLKIFHMMDGKPLESDKGEKPFFAIISVDAKEHGKHSSRPHSLRQSGDWTIKDLWRMGDSKVHSRENFGSYSESSPLDERRSKFSAEKYVRSKGNVTRQVPNEAIGMTPRANRSIQSAKSPKESASPHVRHYTTYRADAEQKRMTTFITYRPSLLACLGFTSKSYRAAVGTQSFRASA